MDKRPNYYAWIIIRKDVMILDMALKTCGPYQLGCVVAICSWLLAKYFLQIIKQIDVVCVQNALSGLLMTHGN
jgi:hypothetical protein